MEFLVCTGIDRELMRAICTLTKQAEAIKPAHNGVDGCLHRTWRYISPAQFSHLKVVIWELISENYTNFLSVVYRR